MKSLADTPLSEVSQKNAESFNSGVGHVLADRFLQYGVPSAIAGGGAAVVMKVLSDIRQNQNDRKSRDADAASTNSFEVMLPVPGSKTASDRPTFTAWRLAEYLNGGISKKAFLDNGTISPSATPTHWAASLPADVAMATVPGIAAYMVLDRVFKNREKKELEGAIGDIKSDYSSLLLRDIERQRAAISGGKKKVASIDPIEALIDGLVEMKYAEVSCETLEEAFTKSAEGLEPQGLKMFYFQGRKNGISATSEEEARKKLKKGGESLKLQKVASQKEAETPLSHTLTGIPVLLTLLAGLASHRYALNKERDVDEYYSRIGKKNVRPPTRVKLVSMPVESAATEPTAAQQERQQKMTSAASPVAAKSQGIPKAANLLTVRDDDGDRVVRRPVQIAGSAAAGAVIGPVVSLLMEKATGRNVYSTGEAAARGSLLGAFAGSMGERIKLNDNEDESVPKKPIARTATPKAVAPKVANLIGVGLLGSKIYEMANQGPTGIKAELATRESDDLIQQDEEQQQLARTMPIDRVDANTVVLNTPEGQIVIDATDPGSLEYLKKNQEALLDSLNSVNAGQ